MSNCEIYRYVSEMFEVRRPAAVDEGSKSSDLVKVLYLEIILKI